MAFLKLDGSKTDYEGEALLDLVKLHLYTPNGAVFGNTSFGYKNLDVSDVSSVRAAIIDCLHNSHGSIHLKDVVKNSNNTITATFEGVDETLTLNSGDN
ncbi:MAG: hypothetical protein MJZ34_02935 [Paludibacteraceae bacterium]|nr:hypothetical protein [Paludibacteraceae bacterium]